MADVRFGRLVGTRAACWVTLVIFVQQVYLDKRVAVAPAPAAIKNLFGQFLQAVVKPPETAFYRRQRHRPLKNVEPKQFVPQVTRPLKKKNISELYELATYRAKRVGLLHFWLKEYELL